MITLPYTTIVEKIREKTNVSEEEINEKVKQKMQQLSGLISKEGAAHIIANELGIDLLSVTQSLKIKDIALGMRNIETVGRVIRKFETRDFDTGERKGKVGSFIIADKTATIRVTAWHDATKLLESFNENDIVKVSNVYVRDNQGQKELHLSDKSEIHVNPEGISLPEYKKPETNRKKLGELKENDTNIEVLGTIVQVFDIRFFETCPECNRRVQQQEEHFFCKDHNVVVPNYSYVLNLFLDDGTENMRVVFFRNQVERLLKEDKEKILSYKTNPEQFDKIKTDLLGEQIKITGRVVKNKMFERLEIIASDVTAADPAEELKKLSEKEESAPVSIEEV